MVSLDDIERARARLAGSIKSTPCPRADTISGLAGADVYLKLENLQVTGSFKARGAGNRIAQLSDDERRRGVICASAGNHAQGVAFHAQRRAVTATIVMPIGTPLIKVARTQQLGADVVLHGDNYDDAYAEARRIADRSGAVFVHAYDDDDVIAGQGTIGLEIAEQVPDVDAVVVPVGGGGLIAGIALALKARRPGVRVVGVEIATLPSMTRALETGHPVELPATRTLAEGIAIRRVGERSLPLVRDYVDEIVLVGDDEIARAILTLLEGEKTVSEGAGAVAVAALLAKRIAGIAGMRVAAVVCGGNIDVTVLARIIERGLAESGRLARLEILSPDRPGALADILRMVAAQRANVVEVQHERAFSRGSVGQVMITVVAETRGPDHVRELRAALAAGGYVCTGAPLI